jgi:predicted metal-dependent hydrolase
MRGDGATEDWTVAGVRVQVRRSARRRTVALQVRPGEVVLYAPVHVPDARLHDFLGERRAWAARHLAQYAARPVVGRDFGDGAALPFMGESLTLRLDPACRRPQRVGAHLRLPGPPEDAERWVEAWTRAACLEPYTALVTAWARTLGAEERLGRVRVSGAGGRWGSCTGRGDIRLHWRLSRAPLEVLRYVALHEAAHLLELNHSPRYWALVARVMPEHAVHRHWLKENGPLL